MYHSFRGRISGAFQTAWAPEFKESLPQYCSCCHEASTSSTKCFTCIQGAFQPRWLDESDCVGAWESETIAAVLFPTGGTLPDVREIDGALVSGLQICEDSIIGCPSEMIYCIQLALS